MTRSEEPAAVAERVSELATSMASFHEVQLLAAQAWLAAADARRARAFARDLLDNQGADDVLRMQAFEVLEAAGESSSAHVAPAAPLSAEPAPAAIQPQAVVSVEPPGPALRSDAPTPRSPEVQGGPAGMTIPRPPLAPSGTDLYVAPSGPAPAGPRTATRPGFPAAPARPSAQMRTLPPGTSLPPYRIEPRGERGWSVPPPGDVELERVETLSLPPGVPESAPLDERPRTGAAARLTCTLLARELGRGLRERFGVEIHDDVDGLETAQRCLREELIDGRVRTPDELREVMRQGAFLAELLARRLGARWVDLESVEPGRWAMLVPSAHAYGRGGRGCGRSRASCASWRWATRSGTW